MFRRRNPLSRTHRVLNFFWPSIGWRRAGSYSLHRLARLPGSAYSIAAGFACGAAISFTPFVGLHFILSAILAWIIRANILASAIGTAVGNPWTFPFIWTWLYQTGTWLTAGEVLSGDKTPQFSEVFGNMMEATLRLDMVYLMETVAPIFWPMLASSVPTGLMIWGVFYFPLKYVVGRYQDRRALKMAGNNGDQEPLQ
ncbi:MAG: DUF2062 domain-containing protein [Alphaproteobacteria bacterium]|jgi:uncharacterized protein|nr:DUF2062 domain-containing protein [Alphaproteobacteria bacterium]MBT7943593.1 DUF2062 domain-containing protein [Alphaproteobacteria bacterium]